MTDLAPCKLCGSHSVEPFVLCVIASDDPDKLNDPETMVVRCQDCGTEAALAVWQQPPVPFNEAAEREAFEIAAVAQFKAWRAHGNVGNDNGSPATRESLCWRMPCGNYGVLMLNAAFWAWIERAKRAAT